MPRFRLSSISSVAVFLLLLALGACDRAPSGGAPASPPLAAPEPPVAQLAADAAKLAAAPRILALGDSLTAGFGLPEEESYPSHLQLLVTAAGFPHEVINGGVSGDTTAGGLARMDWLLQRPAEIVILALGANDGLRGVSVEAMEHNLVAIIEKAVASGARVILAGMKLPTNYGAQYREDFEAVFPRLAKQYDLPLLPFLLEGVAARGHLNQADGIHPNAEGSAIVADNVWGVLRPLLTR